MYACMYVLTADRADGGVEGGDEHAQRPQTREDAEDSEDALQEEGEIAETRTDSEDAVQSR
jgi:hypothetical protein